MMVDSLKTASVGTSSLLVQCLTFIPEMIRIAVAVATLVYLIIKIRRELYEQRANKQSGSNPR